MQRNGIAMFVACRRNARNIEGRYRSRSEEKKGREQTARERPRVLPHFGGLDAVELMGCAAVKGVGM